MAQKFRFGQAEDTRALLWVMTWIAQVKLTLAGLAVLAQSARACLGESGQGSGAQRGDCVVLLHGLGRTALSMKRLEWAFKREGYQVINLSYPSTRLSVEEAAEKFLGKLLRERLPAKTRRIHFVTHSLGGIVLRLYLSNHTLTNLGRVVMLAPPNGGSELADKLKRNWLYRWLTGPAGQEVGANGLPTRLGPADFVLGVIAGDRSFNPLFSALIPGPDDGKVSVRNAKLEGMSDFLVVHSSHTWLMWRGNVVKAAVGFIEEGRFK